MKKIDNSWIEVGSTVWLYGGGGGWTQQPHNITEGVVVKKNTSSIYVARKDDLDTEFPYKFKYAKTKRLHSPAGFGGLYSGYTLYSSKEEIELLLNNKKYRKELFEYVSNNIKYLSNDELNEIKNKIDSVKEGVSKSPVRKSK